MSTYKAIITVNMENGERQTISRQVDAENADKARTIIFDAWVRFLYVESNAHKVVKNSGISIEALDLLKAGDA